MKAGHPPKPAWFHLAAMRKLLGGTRFETEMPSGREEVRIHRFRSEGSAEGYLDVVWCPTSEGKEIAEYALAVEEGRKASLFRLRDDTAEIEPDALPSTEGKITLAVNENPIFLRVR
jgi:hypothetical protein